MRGDKCRLGCWRRVNYGYLNMVIETNYFYEGGMLL